MINLGRVGSISHAKAIHEGGKLQVLTTFEDDAALAQNRKIRDSGMLDRARLELHDDEDIRLVISCPSTDLWALFKKKHREIYKLLHSRSEVERMKGARRMQILHPEWVVYSRL